jgi:hypothetical protein
VEREQELENKGRSSGTRTHACRRRKMTDQGRRRCGRERASVDTERNGDAKKRKSMKRRKRETTTPTLAIRVSCFSSTDGPNIIIHFMWIYLSSVYLLLWSILLAPPFRGEGTTCSATRVGRVLEIPPSPNCLWIRVSKSIAKTHPTPSFDIYI